MGLIAQEAEIQLMKVHAIIAGKAPEMVQPNGLFTGPHGGPVQGTLPLNLPHANAKFDAIEDCLEAIVKALKKLEDGN